MPPFREGPIKIDRRLSGEMLHFLRDVGHGHRINIVDASYDVPQGSRIIEFPGTTAEAFEAIVRLIPVDHEDDESLKPAAVLEMDMDPELSGIDNKHVASFAGQAMSKAYKRLAEDRIGYSNKGSDLLHAWSDPDFAFRLDDDETGSKGFYSIANNPNEPHTFIRTQDDLPFACVSLVVGHSQRTR